MANRATAKVVDRDMGYSDFRRNLKEWEGGLFADIGLLEENVSEEDASLKGALQEFGGTTKHPKTGASLRIPPRPAHRSAFDVRWRKYLQMLSDEISNPTKADFKRAIEGVGKKHTKFLKQTIRKFSNPPNAPFTVAKKGFDDPLIETGEMVASIDYRVHDDRTLGDS